MPGSLGVQRCALQGPHATVSVRTSCHRAEWQTDGARMHAGGSLCCSGEQAAVMRDKLKLAEPFLLGCPACLQNFRNLFCTLFCSPDQAAFANVTAVQLAAPVAGHGAAAGNATVTAVAEVSFYLSEAFKNGTFDSCKDVVFSSGNQPAMTFVGGGATTAQVCLHRSCRKVAKCGSMLSQRSHAHTSPR